MYVFEMARADPNMPVDTSIKTLDELVAEGSIGSIGRHDSQSQGGARLLL